MQGQLRVEWDPTPKTDLPTKQLQRGMLAWLKKLKHGLTSSSTQNCGTTL
jgi:hypothetical protein